MLKNTARYEGLLLVAVVVLSVAVLFAPALYRHANLLGYPMGTEPYREAAIASQGGPESTPYSILLSLLSPSILKSSAFVPQLLGGVSLLALWGILRQLNLPPELRLGSLALLALSPAFIYTFAVSNQYALLIALALSGIFFLVRGSPVSLVFLGVVPFFGWGAAAVVLLAAIVCSARAWLRLSAVALMLVSSVLSLFFQKLPAVTETGLMQANLTEFGALLGFTIFSLLLSLVGMLFGWRSKRKLGWAYFLMLLTLLFSLFVDYHFKALLNIMLSVFAALGLAALVRRRWELRLIRNAALAMLLSGIIITAGIYTVGLAKLDPGLDTIMALQWLKHKSAGRVLSHPDNSYIISYFAQPVLSPDSPELNETLVLLRTRDAGKASMLLQSYGIQYVLVDSKTRRLMMQDNLLGLLFVMRNSPEYRQAEFGRVSVWEHNPIPSISQ